MKKKTHGGRRKGAGRKPIKKGVTRQKVGLTLPEHLADQLRELSIKDRARILDVGIGIAVNAYKKARLQPGGIHAAEAIQYAYEGISVAIETLEVIRDYEPKSFTEAEAAAHKLLNEMWDQIRDLPQSGNF